MILLWQCGGGTTPPKKNSQQTLFLFLFSLYNFLSLTSVLWMTVATTVCRWKNSFLGSITQWVSLTETRTHTEYNTHRTTDRQARRERRKSRKHGPNDRPNEWVTNQQARSDVTLRYILIQATIKRGAIKNIFLWRRSTFVHSALLCTMQSNSTHTADVTLHNIDYSAIITESFNF